MAMSKKKRAGIAGAAAIASLFTGNAEAQRRPVIVRPPIVMPFAYPYNFPQTPFGGIAVPFNNFYVGRIHDPRNNGFFFGVAIGRRGYAFGCLPPWLSYLEIEWMREMEAMRFGPPNGAYRMGAPRVYGTNQTLPEFTGAYGIERLEQKIDELSRQLTEKYRADFDEIREAEQRGFERAAGVKRPVHTFRYESCIPKDAMPAEAASFMNDYFAALQNSEFGANVEDSGPNAFVQVSDNTGRLYQIRFDQFSAADSMSKLTAYLFDTAIARHGKNPDELLAFTHRPYIAEGCGK